MPVTPAFLQPHFLSVSLPLFFCPSLPLSLSECVFLNRLTVIWRHCASLPLNITSVYFLKPRTVLLHDQRCRNEEINLDKNTTIHPTDSIRISATVLLVPRQGRFFRPRIQSRLSYVSELPHLFGVLWPGSVLTSLCPFQFWLFEDMGPVILQNAPQFRCLWYFSGAFQWLS